ncbi:hypothetical protein GIB67_000089 [Kingdonia uniflora]|uniref:aspartate-semialdehyde dehydrogenase n=1 Tax=Kingdonia uniflora TaxID=39325 RepID=A0A7J7M5S4_9MAGN|nr:hypothetical protein GIB67_000089 [Kingdonia uniflora]
MRASSIAYHNQFLSGPTTFARNPVIVNTRRSKFSVRMGMKEDAPSLAIVGVTGAVGQEFLRVLTDRDFPYRSIKMLASKRSAGKQLKFEDKEYIIEELTHDSFDGVDIALFSAGGSISKEFGSVAASRGSIVIDNSSAFRMDDNVPLVIPEVNPDAMSHIKLHSGKGALIANPNCSTIICLMAATPLHRHSKVIRMVVSTYQAASGAGAAAMEELELQTREWETLGNEIYLIIHIFVFCKVLEGKQPTCNIFNQQYAFNLFSHNAPILSNGYNEEEMKLVKETRKIWNDSNVKVTATCIRVPVIRAHAESVNLQFDKPLDEYMPLLINTGRAVRVEYVCGLFCLANCVNRKHVNILSLGAYPKSQERMAEELPACLLPTSESPPSSSTSLSLNSLPPSSPCLQQITLYRKILAWLHLLWRMASSNLFESLQVHTTHYGEGMTAVVNPQDLAVSAEIETTQSWDREARIMLSFALFCIEVNAGAVLPKIIKVKVSKGNFRAVKPVVKSPETNTSGGRRWMRRDSFTSETYTTNKINERRERLWTKRYKEEDTARDILKKAAGLVVIDDRALNHFPTPLVVSSKDDVAVGRIRQDFSQNGNYGLDIFVCGDQIRKGAALNAIQIAELLL